MVHVVDCKSIFNSYMIMAKDIICNFSTIPVIHIIKTGYDEPSERYVKNKVKDFKEIGINTEIFTFDKPEDLHKYLDAINSGEINYVDGIIIQRPIIFGGIIYDPEEFNCKIPLELDIDGVRDSSIFPTACVKALDIVLSYIEKTYKIDLSKKVHNATIIGKGSVGKPVYDYIRTGLNENQITVNDSKTSVNDLYNNINNADLIISAVGFKTPIKITAPNKDKIIIDFGIVKYEVTGKLHGDIDPDFYTIHNMQNGVYYTTDIIRTPVPNGMGLLVRAALISNIITKFLSYGKSGKTHMI